MENHNIYIYFSDIHDSPFLSEYLWYPLISPLWECTGIFDIYEPSWGYNRDLTEYNIPVTLHTSLDRASFSEESMPNLIIRIFQTSHDWLFGFPPKKTLLHFPSYKPPVKKLSHRYFPFVSPKEWRTEFRSVRDGWFSNFSRSSAWKNHPLGVQFHVF